jgi:hypothetical protein
MARWDAVIDVATQPGHVRRAVRDLEPVAAHYLFVSTGNVYASQERIGADEAAERMLPLHADKMTGPDDYGPAKVACEDAVLSGFGAGRSLIAIRADRPPGRAIRQGARTTGRGASPTRLIRVRFSSRTRPSCPRR